MIISKMFKLILKSLFLYFYNYSLACSRRFRSMAKNFKLQLLDRISSKVVNEVMSKAKYLPKVIEYDRYQPEFYEDTFTYIKKRSSNKKLKEGLKLFNKEKITIETIEKDFEVEKELLLALMGIETNFGKYLGKMDIVSSLATLSFDKRRSAFFTEELLILLKLVDQNIIDKKILFGSWAGAFGNFQFMPRTIRNYAIDYNNKTIELKNIELVCFGCKLFKRIGWKKSTCFYKIELNENIPKKYLIPLENLQNKKNKIFKNILKFR